MSRSRKIRRLRRKHARAAYGSKREAAAKRKLDALLAREAPLPKDLPEVGSGRWDKSPVPVMIRIPYISPQGTVRARGLPRAKLARKRMELPTRIEKPR